MKVVGYDPYISDERVSQLGITRIENLDDLLKIADVITIHIPKSLRAKTLLAGVNLPCARRV